MHLVQLLLPVCDNDGSAFPAHCFEEVRGELTQRFGGVTMYARAPAHGTFAAQGGAVIQDDIVVFEVMCDVVERAYWSGYRTQLQARFMQQEVVVRALPMERL